MERLKEQIYFSGIGFLSSFILFALLSFNVTWLTPLQAIGATMILGFLRHKKLVELDRRALSLMPTGWLVKVGAKQYTISDHLLSAKWSALLKNNQLIQEQAMNIMGVARNILKRACMDVAIIFGSVMLLVMVFAYPQFASFAEQVTQSPKELAWFVGLIDRMFNIYMLTLSAFIVVNGEGFGFVNCFKQALARELAGESLEKGGLVIITEFAKAPEEHLAALIPIK